MRQCFICGMTNVPFSRQWNCWKLLSHASQTNFVSNIRAVCPTGSTMTRLIARFRRFGQGRWRETNWPCRPEPRRWDVNAASDKLDEAIQRNLVCRVEGRRILTVVFGTTVWLPSFRCVFSVRVAHASRPKSRITSKCTKCAGQWTTSGRRV